MTLAIGDPAVPFSLAGIDGRDHGLDEYAEATALALVWSCNHCPYVQAWEGRMKAIQADYAGRSVRLVAVNSNDAEQYPVDSFDEMRARARAQGFNFDYLHDPSQATAHAYGPSRTPEVFLFGADRRLVYHGAIDDSRDDRAVTRHYLREALDAVLDGGEPPLRETPPVGCSLKWK